MQGAYPYENFGVGCCLLAHVEIKHVSRLYYVIKNIILDCKLHCYNNNNYLSPGPWGQGYFTYNTNITHITIFTYITHYYITDSSPSKVKKSDVGIGGESLIKF